MAEGRLDSAAAAFLAWNRAEPDRFSRGLPEAAGAMDRASRVDSAIALCERVLGTPSIYSFTDEVEWYPFVLRRLGELHESLGHRDEAKRYYSDFIDLWKDTDPERQPQVEEARVALARLLSEHR